MNDLSATLPEPLLTYCQLNSAHKRVIFYQHYIARYRWLRISVQYQPIISRVDYDIPPPMHLDVFDNIDLKYRSGKER